MSDKLENMKESGPSPSKVKLSHYTKWRRIGGEEV
jgi:hypothetical protein